MAITPKKPQQSHKIVQAAVQLFAHQGYHGTSTREIARLAEISENTLFRHFATKEEIFWTALRSRMDGLKLRRDVLDGIAESIDPEVIVPQILEQLVDTIILKPELLRLIAIAFIELHGRAAAVCYECLSPVFSSISRYLGTKIESGEMRNLDPVMVTTALISTGIMLPEICKLSNASAPTYSDDREAVRAFTKFWSDVLAPRVFATPSSYSRDAESPTRDQPTEPRLD
jgi:AcrR family transcriptional regulator